MLPHCLTTTGGADGKRARHGVTTLGQVTWRVNSRKSFAMSDRLTRNNEINRRLKSGRDDFEDLLPESMRGEACPRLAPYDL